MQELRILVFSASYGAGHLRAAEAIIEAISTRLPNAKVTHVDFMDIVSKHLNNLIRKAYIQMIKYTPKLWGEIYNQTAKFSQHSKLNRFTEMFGPRWFGAYLKKMAPDIIICTYPTIARVLGEQRLQGELDVPVITVITDYGVHSHWVHPGVDLYLVGSNQVYESLAGLGINGNKIQVTGIPVSPRFENSLDKEMILRQLGFDSKHPVCLVMGGAFGVLKGFKELCLGLSRSDMEIQSLIVCGKDSHLFNSLDEVIDQSPNPIRRFGYVNNVEELMTVADIIVTKAGGLTVSEALTKHLPLVMYNPIPGQEEENAFFVKEIGAGTIAYTQYDLKEEIYDLLQSPERMGKMRRAASEVWPGQSAARAANCILGLLKANCRIA